MGIKGLTAIISEHAPKAIVEHDIKTLFGRKVAIDASMSIYQFLIAVRQKDGEMLTNEAGETTSHLMGFFYRTIRIVENGIKPAYVFDGRPPELKSGVLAKRFERREEAKADGEEAKETGTAEEVDKFTRRTVRVTREHNEECQKLLRLMGIPVVIAPSEAEAQCAELARGGKVYAAGSEDMDTLTFATPILYRHLTFSEAKKAPISEINLEKAIQGLEMNMSHFIDLCILLGCDYLEPIKGIGPKSALKLIREYHGLEGVVEHLREKQKKKGGIQVPEEWPWEEAKKLFEKPDVLPASEVELEWKDPDVEGLVQFLVVEKGFNEERVRKGADKLQKFLNAKQQGRLDGFFTVQPKETKEEDKGKVGKRKDAKGKGKEAKPGAKRKAEDKSGESTSKKSKTKK
ncbi:PIN domain-like protein [Boletus edulis BED1]|uniref:Flap endonuclease 1 n=1 Tax=Boletus edulis BED1 TaxID=1328754 RepID=A0AAD4GGM2_BOLED|nr:PIN domain-like protein [Boletus edulis BED1]